MRIIGLTGGIGSGKSTVSRILASLGAEVVDADRVGHAVYAPGTPGWQAVVDRFGAAVVAADGSIDRGRLGSLVFAEPQALADLNAIVHPRIAAALADRIERHRAAAAPGPLVIEAALLVEAGWSALVDEVWVVRAPAAAVIERLRSARGLDAQQIRDRMAAQASDAERLAAADVVIDNDGSEQHLAQRVRAAWTRSVA